MKAKFIIDTGTWMKFDELVEEKIISPKFIKNLSQIANIYITHEIEKELEYHGVNSYQTIKPTVFVVPISNEAIFRQAIEDGYNSADSSIIGIENIENYTIISEDRPLVEYYSMFRLKIMFFADMVWSLLNSGMISKNSAYKIASWLYVRFYRYQIRQDYFCTHQGCVMSHLELS